MEWINRWSCTNNFYKKLLTGDIFLLAPAANHAWYKPIFYWLHETAACCYFGVDLGKGLYQYSFSRLTDGTPHSSSDLLYLTLLLPFYLDKFFPVQLPFSFLLFGPKFSKSNSSSLFSSDKNLSPTSIPQNYSKTIPNSDLAAKSFQSHKNILSPIFFLTSKNNIFFILLPPESKRCPLTLALALACADSMDKPRFWNKSESYFSQLFIYSILLQLESKQCPLTLALVLACADSADELRFWNMSGS